MKHLLYWYQIYKYGQVMWGNVVQTFQPVFDFDRLTLSGLPRIPVTSLTGMLKNEVSFLSWLIVIWVAFVAGNKQKKDETHRELRLQLRFVETGESLASICWLKVGCRQEVIDSGLVLQNILLAISQFFSKWFVSSGNSRAETL